jgi:putative hemolysin
MLSVATLFPAIPAALDPPLDRVLRFDRARDLYRELRGDARGLAAALLARLAVDIQVSAEDLRQVPRQGPVIVAANHPHGILDGAVLATVLGALRPDVKFLANHLLGTVPELADLLIAVDPFGGSKAAAANRRGLRAALAHLAGGGLLVVFPAGAVSHFDWRCRSVRDAEWNPAVARLAERTGAAVLPVFIDGRNSALFQAAGLLDPRLRTALLVRELLKKERARVRVRAGSPVPPSRLAALESPESRTAYLRWRTEVLGGRADFKPRTRLPALRRRAASELEIAAPVPAADLVREIAALPPERLLAESGELRAYLAPAFEIPATLREIGRLREIAFRAAGEGTGSPLDLDRFDRHYLHLFVWHRRKQEIVGAYRMAAADVCGLNGLYTATLFRYGGEFLDRLGPALELGRSFLRLEYQGNPAGLVLMWKAITRFVHRNPRYKVLFGPVSISREYHPLARHIMVSFLRRRAWLAEMAGLVRSVRPFHPRAEERAVDLEDLSSVVADVENGGRGVPVLLRQYLKLGGKLLGFNVDPKFSNVVDGLILVDLTRTEPRLLERYMGAREAGEFLAYHRSIAS